jgi:DNA-binding MarR family transcriptional regulator
MKRKSAGVAPPPQELKREHPAWTFLTNHAHVLWCIYRHPEARLREIAVDVGITERMVHKIVSELAAAKYVRIEKDGRRNVYHVLVERPLRHPLESHCQVGQMLNLFRKTAT